MIHVLDHAMADELPPLAICAQLWEHDWTDAQMRTWQSRVRNAEYGDDSIICNGNIFCDGRNVAGFTRRIEMPDSDELIPTLVVEHENFHLLPTFQGQGFGREWTRQSAQRYVEAGLDQVRIDTGSDGLWTWPRMGFDLMAQDFCDWLGTPCNYSQSIYADEMRAIINEIITRAQSHYCEDITPEQSDQFVQQITALRDLPQGPPRLEDLMRDSTLDRDHLREYTSTLQVPLEARSEELVRRLSGHVHQLSRSLPTQPSSSTQELRP